MNSLVDVIDLTVDAVIDRRYDVALFASGYESRCTALAQRLSRDNARVFDVLGFQENGLLPDGTARSNKCFRDLFAVEPAQFQNSLEARLQQHLKNINRKSGVGPISILVDYSSMSRSTYASVINFARLGSYANRIEIDFCYSIGKYGDSFEEELSQLSVDSITTLPGFEGLSATRGESIAVLGLGFTPLAAFGALEKLQPTHTLAFFADPGALEGYAEICMRANKSLLQSADFQMGLPLKSVETVYKRLAESLAPYLKLRQITMIPMGPKPHVLAALLLSSKFRPMACLYAKTSRNKVSDIPPTGEVVVTRVRYEPVVLSPLLNEAAAALI
jgi:hypothetical protein